MSPVIHIDPPTLESRRLWQSALDLAAEFGPRERWVLVGGLMVQLHAFECGSRSRLTADIDFLGDSRRRPAMTVRMAEVLAERGAEMTMPSMSDENLGYRFELEGSIIEILGSEGVRTDPKTLGKYTTFQVPGGTQALTRSEVVQVSLRGSAPVAVRRPSLLGAILIKARVLERRREKHEADRQDLIRLLGFVDDPRALGQELRKSEKRWLRAVESLLDFADVVSDELFSHQELADAEAAYRLLAA